MGGLGPRTFSTRTLAGLGTGAHAAAWRRHSRTDRSAGDAAPSHGASRPHGGSGRLLVRAGHGRLPTDRSRWYSPRATATCSARSSCWTTWRATSRCRPRSSACPCTTRSPRSIRSCAASAATTSRWPPAGPPPRRRWSRPPALLADGAPEVLVVVYDAQPPQVYAGFLDEPDPFYAWSWRLRAGGDGVRMSLTCAPAEADSGTTAPAPRPGRAALPAVRRRRAEPPTPTASPGPGGAVPERLDHAWRVFGTGISFLAFGVGGLMLGVLVFPAINLLVRDPVRRRRWARRLVQVSFASHIELMRVLGVLTYEVRGRERLQREGLLILANHPTLIDVVFLVSLLPERRLRGQVGAGAQSVHPRPGARGRLRVQRRRRRPGRRLHPRRAQRRQPGDLPRRHPNPRATSRPACSAAPPTSPCAAGWTSPRYA